jgi:hypothetical protein
LEHHSTIPLAEVNKDKWDAMMIEPRFAINPQEHFTRSLHAMIFQELDLYLEERERFILSEIRAVREILKEEKDSIGE